MYNANSPTAYTLDSGLKSSFCLFQITSSIPYSLTWKGADRNGFKLFPLKTILFLFTKKVVFNAGVHFVFVVEAKAHLFLLYTAVIHVAHHKFYYIFYSICIYIFLLYQSYFRSCL